jgi:CDK-activating kinase assembly factor MAT1
MLFSLRLLLLDASNGITRFNKRREDFPDLRSYNDYLEEVEDISKLLLPLSFFSPLISQPHIAFNLLTNTNVAETEQRIARFRAENAALIELNIQREQQDVNLLLEEEEREREERAEMEKSVRDEEEREREVKMREKEDIINKLVSPSHPS